LMGLMDIIT